MTQIAQVIVDVPTMQTNKPYDYSIPERYSDIIQTGMRVVVPFGQGSRQVQGFVVGQKEKSDYPEELKEIASLMDLSPVLSKEHIELAQEMSKQTFSFLITSLQAMLPSALRAEYKKVIQIVDEISLEAYSELFLERDEISFEEAEERGILKELKKLKDQGKVRIQYLVKDKRTRKTLQFVKPLLTFEDYENLYDEIPKNATKQALLIDLLQGLEGQEKPAKAFVEDYEISYSTLKTGQERGWLDQVEREVYRDPYKDSDITQTSPLSLTEEQVVAYEEITQAVVEHQNEIFLLKGITGSGKTEVYMQAIQKVLDQGETTLMLVPEIALTPQMVHRFKGRFGDLVAVMHSGLSVGERYDEWRRIEEGSARIIVGVRSSVFAPAKNIGLIIIDEEHETTYKQNDNPRYHARNVAKWRAQYHSCPVVLGSATPSLETMARAVKGVYKLLELKERPTPKPLPKVEVLDLKDEAEKGNLSDFSEPLIKAIEDRLASDEQIVLLLNRRGYSSFMMCRDCGFVLQCQNCDISLTLHMDTKTMKCHYCGYEEPIPQTCDNCGSHHMRYYGTGTQKVEKELEEILPKARVIRMDNDTTRRKGAYERLLRSFGNHEADILLGTQMIAKGLDFSNVTLVGVLNGDTSLYLPDFRASEKTFQLLTQVSGRAGRGDQEGEVIVQTYNPDHYAIQLAQEHNYDRFFNLEMKLRHQGNYAPYYYTYRISVSHPDELKAAKKINEVYKYIQPVLTDDVIVLGPTPKAIARLQNRYHYQILIKYKKEGALQKRLHQYMFEHQKDYAKNYQIAIDPEPTTFM